MIQYGHVLDIIDSTTGKRVFAVAAERNQLAGALGGGSHFICGYDGGNHLNYGASDDYADRDKFLAKALELAREHLKLPPDAGAGYSARPKEFTPLSIDEMLGGEVVVGKAPGKPQAPAPAADPEAGEIVVAKPASRPTDGGELVVASTRPKDAGEPVVTQRASRPGVGPSLVPGLQMSLGGVALIALSLLLNVAVMLGMLDFEVPLMWLILPAGLVLFAVGCMRSAESADGLAAVWARRAGVIGWVAAGLAIIKVVFGMVLERGGLGELMVRTSTTGVFMLALACHAAFLIHLAVGLGLRFKADSALNLLWLWVLLAFVRSFSTWINYGYVPPWIDAATLLGLVIWVVFQLTMIAKARPR
jgi:hypothetical protein